jgi:protein-S-isoprenylcysteine O-methyltransferase Ste14
MATHAGSGTGRLRRLAAGSTIALSFIVALEIVVMISPFALFFYSAFNPVLLALGRHPLTRWLTAFFLPHMIVPPDAVLATVRVLGSVLFVFGLAAFLACAIQVYAGKALGLGVAERGLYAIVRHPQYLALGVSGLGLAILWPRFLTLVLLAIMLFLYYVLARDEERRMLDRHGEAYGAYLARTGMFFPRWSRWARPRDDAAPAPIGPGRAIAVLVGLFVVLVGGGFAARAYTIRHLPVLSVEGVDVLAISQSDLAAARHLLPALLRDPAVAAGVAKGGADGHRVLAYIIPVDYTMQGMIADTGEQWRLFEHHRTLPMIAEYILHPFGHLTEGHAHTGSMGSEQPVHDSPAMQRRVIFIDVFSPTHALTSARDDFGIGVERRPLLFADVHLHTGEVLQVKDLPGGSGWGRVPTPTF